MYIVPMEVPKYCNACPFAVCNYNRPKWAGDSVSKLDGEKNLAGTCGYSCTVEFLETGRYTKIIRGNIGEDIPRPEWCGLKEVEG